MQRESGEEKAVTAQASADIVRGTTRLLFNLGYRSLSEFPLGNRRRADIAALSKDGRVIVVEVKSGPADFRSDGKWMDYLDYCDRFYFAVQPDFPLSLIETHDAFGTHIGIILADRYGGHVHREPGEHPLASARRRALTLRFARRAAARLQHLDDPNLSGLEL